MTDNEQISPVEEVPHIRRLGRRAVFRNTMYEVFADHVIDASGNEVLDYMTVMPLRLIEDGVSGVAVVPIRGDQIGLLRMYRPPMDGWGWEVVKGHVENGENGVGAALRELREETGYVVAADVVGELGQVAPEPGLFHARTRLYRVHIDASVPVEPVERELGQGELRFFAWQDILDLFAKGEIEDATTIALLHLSRAVD